MSTEVDLSQLQRATEALHARNWGTVLCRWFTFENPDTGLTEEELERIGDAYLRMIARDMLEALGNDGSGNASD